MTDDALRELLRGARTIAVVGLSPKAERPSHGVARYLQREGYRIVPVNPSHASILGEKSFPSLREAAAHAPIEVVDVFRRSEHAGAVVDDAIAIGAKLIWLQEGVVDQGAERRAEAAGVPLVMDRCLAVEHQRLEV
ncbi:MAG: CoA-binding protein [Gemmatimonadales bacterium]